jgi:Skp family chaperone for outer membrane proteins
MRDIAEEVGAEKKYDLILETTESGMIYRSSAVTDITTTVVERYNSKHP